MINSLQPSMAEDSITEKPKANVLGVILKSDLQWDEHIQYATSDISMRINKLMRLKYYMPYRTL